MVYFYGACMFVVAAAVVRYIWKWLFELDSGGNKNNGFSMKTGTHHVETHIIVKRFLQRQIHTNAKRNSYTQRVFLFSSRETIVAATAKEKFH